VFTYLLALLLIGDSLPHKSEQLRPFVYYIVVLNEVLRRRKGRSEKGVRSGRQQEDQLWGKEKWREEGEVKK